MQISSEGPARITKATIDAVWRRRKRDHRLIVRDKDCRGLALVVNATTMRWEYGYRPRGIDPGTGRRWPNRTVTLGNPETHSPDDARTEANRIKGHAAAGGDPSTERKAKAEAERRRRGGTMERLMDDYAKALPKRPKMRGAGLPSAEYVAVELAQVRFALDNMDAGGLPASELAAQHVRQLLSNGEAANLRARFGALHRFCDWLQDAGHIEANPCIQIARTRRPKPPQARAHYLALSELARLWRAAERLREQVWRDLARFLIAVPCRRAEAAQLEWPHLDLEAAEWRQPGRLTKNRDPHRLHLHPLALDLLKARRQSIAGRGGHAEGLVFPAPRSRDVIETFSKVKAELVKATAYVDVDKSAELNGWTWHDFRRSFATALGEAGVSEAVADAILNHRQSATRGGVLGVYQRASRWPEQVRAMQLWGRMLASAIEGRDGLEVVMLQTRIG